MDEKHNPSGSVWIRLVALLACTDPFSAIAASFNSLRIEKTDDLGTGEWSTIFQFEAGSETTNAAVTLDSETGYLRTIAP